MSDNVVNKIRKTATIDINLNNIDNINIKHNHTFKLLMYIFGRYNTIKNIIKLEPVSIERDEHYMKAEFVRYAIKDLTNQNILIPIEDNVYHYKINTKFFHVT